jgi:cytochrome oxidase Cu insertion factor (SCO1/SenC/PrrC family)/thiol-disulfide isomerase/thioredoxin
MVGLLTVVVALGAGARLAQADGDPGSDVLVNQDLFVAGDSGISIPEQTRLGTLLQEASRAGMPIRVAVIAHPDDLGAVTQLWGKPRAYAHFLGIELSLAYRGRLLVVMPDGLGFNWPGHPAAAAYRRLAGVTVRPGPGQLVSATGAAVASLAAAAGVRIGSPSAAGGSTSPPAAPSAPAGMLSPSTIPVTSSSGGSASAGSSTDQSVGTVAALVVGLALLFALGRWALRQRRDRAAEPPRQAAPRPAQLARILPGAVAISAVAVLVSVLVLGSAGGGSADTGSHALASNPYLDPGTPVNKPAADFTLDNQFGHRVRLSSFRGKVVILAFTDSECTTICPMTTTAMADAKAMLGPAAASRVELMGVDANPSSTSLEDVYAYSQLHGLLHSWDFLTGTLPQLKRVWTAYGINAEIQRGLISHTPALMVISPHGREVKIYMTQQSYSAVSQLAQILAHEASSLLPGHPAVHSHLSYAPVARVTPTQSVSLPRAGGGTERFGPGRPHLYVFFATWAREITSLAGHLDALNTYARKAQSTGLPQLTAVDEGRVEASRQALPDFLRGLPRPLAYPVAVDPSGQVADGYQVLGEPWLVLTSAIGQVLWYQQISTSGWPSEKDLLSHVRSALARAPAAPTSPAQVARDLAGSPAPLAAVHQQAGQLLGTEPALAARIRALRGYPIVLNAWASWCTPCQDEFHLFAAAAALYGRRIAFLGADTNDSTGNAAAFLRQHPVSYPSYQTNSSDMSSIAAIGNLPTTVFISPSGKVKYVHIGQYDNQSSLDGDISSYALAK